MIPLSSNSVGCGDVQTRVNYKGGGIPYGSAHDGYVFQLQCADAITIKKIQAGGSDESYLPGAYTSRIIAAFSLCGASTRPALAGSGG
ncbi:hypothetical protein G881_02012 [Escherichia coli KOEGE 30 (63a)]|nr:hypothetical protein G881_02012 [Escherichia coli KOEGE 30 (63a)]